MRLRKKEMRRVFLFAAMVAVLAGIIVYVKHRPQPALVMPPKPREEAVLREMPPEFKSRRTEKQKTEAHIADGSDLPNYKNGYFVLVEAAILLPDRPSGRGSVAMRHPVAKLLVLHEQELPALGDYLQQCEPVIRLARTALGAAYFRYPEDHYYPLDFSRRIYRGASYFSRLMAAQAVYLAQAEEDLDRALETLTDAVMLTQLCLSDGGPFDAMQFRWLFTNPSMGLSFADFAKEQL